MEQCLVFEESRVSLYRPDGQLRIYRRSKELVNFADIQFISGSILVLVGILLGVKTEIHVFNKL